MSGNEASDDDKLELMKLGVFPTEDGKYAVFPDIDLLPNESYQLTSLENIESLKYRYREHGVFNVVLMVKVTLFCVFFLVYLLNFYYSILISAIVLIIGLVICSKDRSSVGSARVANLKEKFPSAQRIDIKNAGALPSLLNAVLKKRTLVKYIFNMLFSMLYVILYYWLILFNLTKDIDIYEEKVLFIISSLLFISVVMLDFLRKELPVAMFFMKRGHWPTVDNLRAEPVN